MKSSAYVIEIEQAEKETRRLMLNTRHKIATQITQITQLTNNWNELEEWIKKENSKYIPTDPYMDGTNATYEEILDKMKEIKGDTRYD